MSSIVIFSEIWYNPQGIKSNPS